MGQTRERIMKLSQRPECIDLMLHHELGDDYPYEINLQKLAYLLCEIFDIMQQANLTGDELEKLEHLSTERLSTERYKSNKSISNQNNEITW